MTRRQYTTLAIAWLLGLLFATAAPAHAQSTAVGRGLFSAFDVLWERTQRHNPWMYRLDDTNAKTWVWHGALTEIGGRALGLTPMSNKAGRRTMAAFYVARELYNIAFEKNRKYGDAFMDALLPVLVAETRLHIRIRLSR